MKRVIVYRAARMTSRSEPTEDLEIVTREEFPELPTLAESRALHEQEGIRIVDALMHLSGGTVNAVLRELLERHASLLRVANPSPPADFRALASAMQKMLPPPILADVIAHLDPVTPFVAFLREQP